MSFNEKKFRIIENLLDAGNQCLIRFSGRNELASEHDKRVSYLYDCFEKFFFHGLKENQNLYDLSRKMMSINLSNSPNNFSQFIILKENGSSFWKFVCFFLNKHEIERFTNLKKIETNLGRGRAWLRSSLNEHKLERYIKAMLENGSTILNQFYEKDAAIRELTMQNKIIYLVSELNTVLFASTIDNYFLNNLNIQTGRKLYDNLESQEQNKNQFLDKNEKLSSESQVNDERLSDCSNELVDSLKSKGSKTNLSLPISRNNSYTNSHNFDEKDLFDKSDDEMVNSNVANVLLTPIVADNYSMTDQFISNFDDDEKASDFSNQSCSTSCSSTPAFHSKELINFENSKKSMKNFENKMLSYKFEDQSEKNKIFMNDDERLENYKQVDYQDKEMLESKLNYLEEKYSKLEFRFEKIKIENDSLKIQLRKYIDAISLLQTNDKNTIINCAIDSKNSFLNTENEQNHTDINFKKMKSCLNANAYLNFKDSVEYEKKLVQVAEMHGEIVEYNDRLHQILMQKDATIKRLKNQLVELRGPLPDTIQVSDEEEICSISSNVEHRSLQIDSNLIQNICPLINVWIPSAFLADQKQAYQSSFLSTDQNKNKKLSSHHVYQIYIRIKDDEWNVYRRYSQFYTFHQILKKKNHQISALEFPPKKTIGNRQAKVVQERRKKLEAYLRATLNILQKEHNIHDRNSLIEILPFLSEKYVMQKKNSDSSIGKKEINSYPGESVLQQQDYNGL